MMQRLFIVDLDDTLLSNGGLPKGVGPVWREIIQSGAAVTIATARGMRAATAPLGDAVPRLPMVALNGAVIIAADGSYTKIHDIPRELASCVCQLAENSHLVPCFLVTDGWNDSILVSERTDRFTEWTLNDAGYFKAHSILRRSTLTTDTRTKLVRIVFCTTTSEAHELKQSVNQAFSELDTLIISSRDQPGQSWLEIGAAKASKAYGITHIASLLSVPLPDIVYYGDALSDLGSMAIVGESVAVANAQNDVLAAATRIIGSAESGAVAFDILTSLNLRGKTFGRFDSR